MTPLKLGLFGGSFDPPHLGHLRLANAAVAACGLQKMVILPAACSPFKRSVFASDADRLAMCRRTFSAPCFEISDFELDRGGKSYTVDTVAHFRRLYPAAALTLLMGEDQLLSFDRWYRWQEILQMTSLCAAVRTGDGRRETLESFADAHLRQYGAVTVLEFEPFPLSSTEIRQKVQKSDPVSGLVSPETEKYILEKGLYCGL